MAAKASAGPSKHGPECSCVRCVGFRPENAAAIVKHGAYLSPAKLSEETDALAEMLAPLVPAYRQSDSVMVSLLALTLRRVARAEPAIAGAEDGDEWDRGERLRRDQRQWLNSAVRILDLLGMDPTARIRLGLDIANTRRALTVADLHAQAAEEAEAEADDEDEAEEAVA